MTYKWGSDPVVQLVALVVRRLEAGESTTVRQAVEELGWSKGTTGELFRLARSRGWLDDDGVPTGDGLEVAGRV